MMRIVSLSPSTTEILFALGVGDQIVANTAYCDFPEAAKLVPKIGSFIYINDEKIAALRPDLVVTSTVVQHGAEDRYKDMGFQHIHLDPRSLEDIYESIQVLGEAVGQGRTLAQVVTAMQKQVEAFRLNSKKSGKKRPRVYIEEWFKPPMASGNWVPDIVEAAGGEYFPNIKTGEISRKVSLEEVEEFDPEFIFLSYCGYKDKSDPQIIYEREGWQDLNAVKNKRVFALNDDLLNRPGPRVVQAIGEIQQHLLRTDPRF